MSVGTTDAAVVHRRATAFFLGWLILAASMSLAGNVGHALLIAPVEMGWLAAGAALEPPIVLLAATHSATWLVRARSAGWVYWTCLALTAALAVGSFALSFDALRSFAVVLGIRESLSWIWPAVIDVAIAHATLCLLSMARPARVESFSTSRAAAAVGAPELSVPVAVSAEASGVVRDGVDDAQSANPVSAPGPGPAVNASSSAGSSYAGGSAAATRREAPADSGAVREGVAPAGGSHPVHENPEQCPQRLAQRSLSAVATVVGSGASPAGSVADSLPGQGLSSGGVQRWRPVAESLVHEGVTAKDVELVARILADGAAGTAPSTIGRRHEVHHTTVSRILGAAARLGATG